MINLLKTFFLGIVQGITEFFPISSSAHIALLSKLINFESTVELDAFLHIGSFLSLLIFYRKRLVKSICELKKSKKNNIFIKSLLTSIPALFFGYFFYDKIRFLNSSKTIILITLIIIGFILIFIDLKFIKNSKKISDLTYKKSFLIGFFQIFSFIKGFSRSASVIIGGFLFHLKKEDAVDYAFFSSIPIFFGITLSKIKDLILLKNHYSFEIIFTSVFSSFFSGFFAIFFTSKIVKKFGLKFFGIYRIVFAIIFSLTFLIQK